ncbi:Choline-sulfatase [Planctomycetes bacterium CA13]|uniref:Choline-sulfatase n=1 Tax=Novipirellula herctigrandis TaxID=2527986 RepID=A0A5C5YVK7_9BACT|nr:Choline-sulfatase [Planctomycetes bacterium CA13]
MTALDVRRFFFLCAIASVTAAAAEKPNIILIMTDDQGWGQTGYYNHPVLQTPHLDEMAAGGLRFDRFYAGAPVCSPTRASVLTGRTNDRTGVPSHGHALRLQERTLSAALKKVGYATGHFGKWHLNGLRGPGVPVLGDDTHSPGAFGFDEWLTVSNFFDMNPVMSRNGTFVELQGDSSEIIVNESLKFIAAAAMKEKPFLAVIWAGSPHGPWLAKDEDRDPFKKLDSNSQHHYGELAAFDRSVGVLRKGLRDLDVADNTLVWFCSDNGGLAGIKPGTVGGLRGHKGSVFEGGLRVPCIVEWPSTIKPRITSYPAATMDIFPTIVEILELPDASMLEPIDGISLVPLLSQDSAKREKPLPFRFGDQGALLDNHFKLVTLDRRTDNFQLFDLKRDPTESKNIAAANPEVFAKMKSTFRQWSDSVDASIAGKDYPEGHLNPGEPESHLWTEDDRYQPFFEQWKKRPEYAKRLNDKSSKKTTKKPK